MIKFIHHSGPIDDLGMGPVDISFGFYIRHWGCRLHIQTPYYDHRTLEFHRIFGGKTIPPTWHIYLTWTHKDHARFNYKNIWSQ